MYPKLSKYRVFFVLFSASLFVFPTVAQLVPQSSPLPQAHAQTPQTNCPASNTIRITTYPLPNSFNLLTSAGFSSFFIPSMEQYSVYPYPVEPNGSLYWNMSLTNQVTHNSNYTQWSFHVTPGLKWSDGTNVTARDIVNTYSAQYGLDPNYDFVGLHTEITSATTANTSTAVFTLNQSDAHLPEKMSSLIYMSVQPQSAIQQGPGANLFGTTVVNGPYYVSNYTSGSSQLVMLRNPYAHPLPKACEMDVNFVESTTQATEFLVSGTTDLAGPLDPSNVAALSNLPNIHLIDEKGHSITTLEYNVSAYPYNMTAFRQALAYAINYSQVVSQSDAGYAVAANNAEGTVPSTAPSYNSNIIKYSYDPSQSLKLLQSIGFTKASDGVLHYPNGTAVSITIWTDSEATYDVSAASLVQSYLQGLGIQASTRVVTASDITGDYSSNVQGIRNSIILFTSLVGPMFGDMWLNAQPGWNVYLRPGYANNHWEYPPSADVQYQSNLTAIDTTANATLEQEYLNNIQSINSQFLPVIVLSYPDNIWAYNTQNWGNWPSSSSIFEYANWFNDTMLATIQPVGGSSTTATQGSTTSTSGTAPTTGVATTTSGSPSTSSTSSSSGGLPVTLIAAAVVIVIIVAGVAAYLVRRR